VLLLFMESMFLIHESPPLVTVDLDPFLISGMWLAGNPKRLTLGCEPVGNQCQGFLELVRL
jgi:hypothetical protein